MPRYIDAEILKKAMSHYGSEDVIYRDEIEMYIDDTPTADVVERKRGEWIKDEESIFAHRYRCSVCAFYRIGAPTKYCEDCGADMRKEMRGNEKVCLVKT